MDTAKSSIKIKLIVDEQTAHMLDTQSKICNWLYNHLVQTAKDLKFQYIASDGQDKDVARIVYTKRGLRDLIPGIRQQAPFINSVYGRPLQGAAIRLSRSIKSYQDYKKGKRPPYPKVGWPGFKGWNRKWFSLEYDYIPGSGGYTIDGRNITLSLGTDETGKRLKASVRLVEALPASVSEVCGLRIIQERKDYYAIFVVNRRIAEKKPKLKIIALDPNHKNLMYGVGTDGHAIEIANFAPMKTFDKRIDEVKSKRDRCKRRSKLVQFERDDGSVHRHWEPSRRWKKYDEALDRLYKKRDAQTKLFLSTVANRLCREYDVIAIGDYTPHGGGITTGMRRAMNNQSLIGRFKKIMEWTAKKSGKHYLEYNERRTTRTCHICGLIVDGGISPDIRVWVCTSCQTEHIRDENAAHNGLRIVLKKLSLPDLGPVQIVERCTWRVLPSGISVCRRGETTLNGNCPDELNRGRGSPRPLRLENTEIV